jgi:monofunctional biosynthetic peptidoglycan transglycosylase
MNGQETAMTATGWRSQRAAWRLWARRLALALFALGGLMLALALAYRIVAPPVSSLMLIRALGGAPIDYRWVPIENISPNLVRSVVAAEDARFCLHHGVDWEVMRGLVAQVLDNEDEGPSRGGSTITMQTAKNLFLWPQRSYVRKAVEIPLAYWIDFAWPKERIVEVYLNVAEWGPGIYGAEAAARHHFGKAAGDLTRREAALLAAVLPNPLDRVAGKPTRQVKRRAGAIQRRVAGTLAFLDCLPTAR